MEAVPGVDKCQACEHMRRELDYALLRNIELADAAATGQRLADEAARELVAVKEASQMALNEQAATRAALWAATRKHDDLVAAHDIERRQAAVAQREAVQLALDAQATELRRQHQARLVALGDYLRNLEAWCAVRRTAPGTTSWSAIEGKLRGIAAFVAQ